MTTSLAAPRQRTLRPLPVPVELGLREGRRIVLHPISLLALVLFAVLLQLP